MWSAERASPKVLKALCSNPHGLFWAGDTAQTIAAGSSFRLGELKGQLYESEVSLGLGTDRRPKLVFLTLDLHTTGMTEENP